MQILLLAPLLPSCVHSFLVLTLVVLLHPHFPQPPNLARNKILGSFSCIYFFLAVHDVLLQMPEQNDSQAQDAMGSGFHAMASGFDDAQSILLFIFHINSAEALFPITRPVSSKRLHKGILHGKHSAAKLTQALALACRLQHSFNSEQGPLQQAVCRRQDWCAANRGTKR